MMLAPPALRSASRLDAGELMTRHRALLQWATSGRPQTQP